MRPKVVALHFVLTLAIVIHGAAVQAEVGKELSLFNGRGVPVAYIDVEDELTIYMWSGKPVAYLKKSNFGERYNIYGFNGKHLGWFARGAIFSHVGTAACATSQVMSSGTQGEPGKPGKQGKPGKAGTEGEPGQPGLSSSFGDTPCEFLLNAGRN